MLLTKREEQLLQAFQNFGKLSIDNITAILKVSKRTVYRTISDLTRSLSVYQIDLVKSDNKYYLQGDLSQLSDFVSQKSYTRVERLQRICYDLLSTEMEVTNEILQERYSVSNVTIIQDIADIEQRFLTFDVTLLRNKGYKVNCDARKRRRLLAILIANALPLNQLKRQEVSFLSDFEMALNQANLVLEDFLNQLPEMDAKLRILLVAYLALANWNQLDKTPQNVSKTSLDFSQKVFNAYSRMTGKVYGIDEILFFAAILDEVVINRQDSPLFNEKFDSNFFYNVSNLIGKVSLYTKIDFEKDHLLFKLLFNHIRLSLAVPTLFEDSASQSVAHDAIKQNDYLHRLISQLVKDIFPLYLQSESEYSLITLHFASSLRRSPTIYPIQILVLTDERPLARELLATKIRTIAPFVDSIDMQNSRAIADDDLDYYDAIFTTTLSKDKRVKSISIYPEMKEMLQLQDYLQNVQLHRQVRRREKRISKVATVKTDYLSASRRLLESYDCFQLDNSTDFRETINQLVTKIAVITDPDYLAEKLYQRFQLSPMAIPETHLALLHTYSSKVDDSCFKVVDLKQPIKIMSMNHKYEEVKRILVMLTKIDEHDEIREFMTAISQSIIENNLYTEIYKTGNQEIIYQLLNQIFTEKIKKLET